MSFSTSFYYEFLDGLEKRSEPWEDGAPILALPLKLLLRGIQLGYCWLLSILSSKSFNLPLLGVVSPILIIYNFSPIINEQTFLTLIVHFSRRY